MLNVELISLDQIKDLCSLTARRSSCKFSIISCYTKIYVIHNLYNILVGCQAQWKLQALYCKQNPKNFKRLARKKKQSWLPDVFSFKGKAFEKNFKSGENDIILSHREQKQTITVYLSSDSATGYFCHQPSHQLNFSPSNPEYVRHKLEHWVH